MDSPSRPVARSSTRANGRRPLQRPSSALMTRGHQSRLGGRPLAVLRAKCLQGDDYLPVIMSGQLRLANLACQPPWPLARVRPKAFRRLWTEHSPQPKGGRLQCCKALRERRSRAHKKRRPLGRVARLRPRGTSRAPARREGINMLMSHSIGRPLAPCGPLLADDLWIPRACQCGVWPGPVCSAHYAQCSELAGRG